jgi:hypothetical protein
MHASSNTPTPDQTCLATILVAFAGPLSSARRSAASTVNRFRPHAVGAFAALCLFSGSVAAAWTPADLDRLTQAFVTRISSTFQATAYPFQFLDPARCFATGKSCFGSNPDSQYGFPSFDTNETASRLKATEALVLIMETPPPMRYFGITPYIVSRFYQSLPTKPRQAGVVPVFESLGDTINLFSVATAGSPAPGQVPFSQLSVFVMTADATTYAMVLKQFTLIGFPSSAINLVTMPINDVPLNMGATPTSDKYMVLMRTSYADSQVAMSDYMRRVPVRTLKLTPMAARQVSPLPSPTSKVPGSGTAELVDLGLARDQLAAQLLSRYGGAYVASENRVSMLQTRNYWCVQYGLPCNGDNPDGLYGADARGFVPASRSDKFLIVGIDHVRTGKASYVSHAAMNEANDAGVVAVDDVRLRGSALTMGNVSGPDDPRYPLYSQLYAFTLSYDCTGERVCVQIPEPTTTDPVGIVFGNPISVAARYYLDPATNTRPSLDEVIPHRVFILRKR